MKILNIMAGPPSDINDDFTSVDNFLSHEGQHFVCGGTTSTIVANHLKVDIDIPIEVDEESDALPFGLIGGRIIATEGVITLTNVALALERKKIPSVHSGEYQLYSALLESDEINIFFGRAKNKKHCENISFEKKKESILKIQDELIKLKKKVNLYQN